MAIIMLDLSKMMLVQVKVPFHDGILAPECIQERLARVPSTQFVRYIMVSGGQYADHRAP